MDFGQAIKLLKQGNKVGRKGWNGKGMWIVLMPALYLEAGKANTRTIKHIGKDTPLDCQPYIVMWTAETKMATRLVSEPSRYTSRRLASSQ